MSSLYTANPKAIQIPAFEPGGGRRRLIQLPSSADPLDPTGLYQAHKSSVDDIAYINSHYWTRIQQLYQMKPQNFTTQQDPVPNKAELSLIMSGAGVAVNITEASGGVGYLGQSALIYPGTAFGAYAFAATSSKVVPFAPMSASQYFSFEADVNLSSAFTNTQGFYVGFGDAQNLSTASNYAFAYFNGGPTYQLAYKAGAYSFNVNSTYTPPQSTWHSVRIELFSAFTSEGGANGAALMRVSFNNAFTQSLSLTTFQSGNMYLSAGGAFGAGGTGVPLIILGTYTGFWNHS